MYQSVPSLTISPGQMFWKGKFPTPGHKESANPDPGQKNRVKTPPPEQLFSETQQLKTVLNEMLIC